MCVWTGWAEQGYVECGGAVDGEWEGGEVGWGGVAYGGVWYLRRGFVVVRILMLGFVVRGIAS